MSSAVVTAAPSMWPALIHNDGGRIFATIPYRESGDIQRPEVEAAGADAAQRERVRQRDRELVQMDTIQTPDLSDVAALQAPSSACGAGAIPHPYWVKPTWRGGRYASPPHVCPRIVALVWACSMASSTRFGYQSPIAWRDGEIVGLNRELGEGRRREYLTDA
ncbi:hypothetical protein BD311DRAFT_818868 [Dichomitus squalens]|uniref:Uncharacterized protein n=1 Tax=Dichomitus squalens TaxID=114155 RepID=A0A4Q9MVA0_9APHY|nr:hypothetical protein BD311DRAFT_818868 [Dichomitus squalens]